jgi:membrane-associated phospholipid phosphatase
MILSQTLADAFIECWKVKYTYWTKRPDMVGKNIQTAMDNPPFPSYVSGHSTISAAAATVLANFFPKKKDFYIENAENARDSRLWAGIHFNYDNMQGYELGKKIGEEIISKIK